MSRIIIPAILFLLLFSSCSEDRDGIFPSILISSPAENSNFRVLEPIPLRIEVNDNEDLEYVRVSMSEISTGRSVLNSLNFNPSSSSFSIDQDFSISDSLLNSGQYSLRVDASDGTNTASTFVSINIIGIPKRSLSLIMALDRTNSVDFVQRFKDQSQSSFHTSSSCGEIAFNSRYQQLWYSKPGVEKIAAFDFKESGLKFEDFPNSNAQSDRILDVCLLKDKFYVSTNRGTVQAFSPFYQDVFTYQSPIGSKVEEIYPMKDRIMVRENDLQANNQRLLYLFGSGAIESRPDESTDIGGVAHKESEDDAAHLFLNKTNGFEVKQLNLSSGQSSLLASKSNVRISSILRINDFEFILITDKTVYQYNLSTSFLRSLATNLNSPKVAYDEVDRLIYIASGSSLSGYDEQSGNLVLNVNHAFPIIDITVRYNK